MDEVHHFQGAGKHTASFGLAGKLDE